MTFLSSSTTTTTVSKSIVDNISIAFSASIIVFSIVWCIRTIYESFKTIRNDFNCSYDDITKMSLPPPAMKRKNTLNRNANENISITTPPKNLIWTESLHWYIYDVLVNSPEFIDRDIVFALNVKVTKTEKDLVVSKLSFEEKVFA